MGTQATCRSKTGIFAERGAATGAMPGLAVSQVRRAFGTTGQRTLPCADHDEQIRRLKRFLSPQVTRFILSCDEDELLQCRRREITVVFCDLRGYTAFTETTAPDDVMTFLRMYHRLLGRVITDFNGTIERFTGDGIMVYLDEPPIEAQAENAVRMALRLREGLAELCALWRRWGSDLDFGIGIALGLASVGTVGFEGRYDYAAIGPVTNLGSRLCARAARGQILINQRVYAAVQGMVDADLAGSLDLHGFHSRVTAYFVRDLKANGSSSDRP